jgi:TonB family protein
MIAIRRTLLLGLVWLFPGSAQQTEPAAPTQDATNTACAEKIGLPVYPPLARQARIEGTLSVTVEVGTNGAVERISAQSHVNNDRAQAILLTAIETSLRKSQFRSDCAGKRLVLEFEFRLTGDPYDRQTQEVAFGYPNRFFITARPPIPITQP